jgi:hypothetical protein
LNAKFDDKLSEELIKKYSSSQFEYSDSPGLYSVIPPETTLP